MLSCSRRIAPRDVIVELFDHHFVSGYNPLNEVARGNHTYDPLFVKRWKVTDAVFRHKLHALVNRRCWCHSYYRMGHDLPDEGVIAATGLRRWNHRVSSRFLRTWRCHPGTDSSV